MNQTVETRAVVAFVLAVTLILGSWQRLATYVGQLIGDNLEGDFVAFLVSLVPLLVGVAIFWMALGIGRAGLTGWAGTLGQAAAVLALVGVAVQAVGVLAQLVGNGSVYSF